MHITGQFFVNFTKTFSKEMASQPNVRNSPAKKLACQENVTNKRLIRTQSLPVSHNAFNSMAKLATSNMENVEKLSQQSNNSQRDSVLGNSTSRDYDDDYDSNEESQKSNNESQQSQQMTDSQLKLAMIEKRWYAAVKENGPLAYLDSSQDASSQESCNPSQEKNTNECKTQ